MADVSFNGAWSGNEKDEAFIAAVHDRVYWRVVRDPVVLETYVPMSEVLTISSGER